MVCSYASGSFKSLSDYETQPGLQDTTSSETGSWTKALLSPLSFPQEMGQQVSAPILQELQTDN